MAIKLKNWKAGDPSSLSMEEAIKIREFKKASNYGALADYVFGQKAHEFPMIGWELSKDAACRILGITLEELLNLDFEPMSDLCQTEQSLLGNYFWWD